VTDPSTNPRHEIRSSKQKPLQSSAAYHSCIRSLFDAFRSVSQSLGKSNHDSGRAVAARPRPAHEAIRPERQRAGLNSGIEPRPSDMARCG
jgi:hypothetical protein